MNRKVLFVHDGPMYHEKTTNQYFGVHYDDKIVRRYVLLGDRVTFLMRLAEVSPERAKQLSPILEPKFSFIEIPNFKSIRTYFSNKKKAKSKIEEAVKTHDLLVIRLPSAAGTIAFKKAQELNKPVLVEFVACVFDALWNYDWRGKLLAHFKLRKYQKLMLQASHTIYVTNQFLQSRYPTKGKAIGCSDVEIAHIDRDVLQRRLEKIRRQKDLLTLCTVAALDVPYKGQADVIKAIGQLKKEGILFKYKLIGQGNPAQLEKAIEKYNVKDLVEIIGPLPHNKVFDFLETIDIYIQPSKVEGLPRALAEAMSKACPSLGSAVGGIPELISEECTFKPGSVEEIIRKLKRVDTPWLLEQAGLNFQTAKEYQKEVLEERRKAFYQEFLQDWELKHK